MGYPFEVGGPDDYPVRVGSMLFTVVDPNPGFERAYNRWYERDHFYAGCMIGPFLFAGRRFVATRELKDLRWPTGSEVVAKPTGAGSFVSVYWVEAGHHREHFDEWARPQVNILYREGRGFPERTHVHTALYDHIGSDVYRDGDPVPVSVALDHGYDAMVALWFDAREGDAHGLAARLAADEVPALLAGSGIESVSAWTPSAGENDPKDVPMDLGSRAGGPERLLQLCFLHGDVRAELARLRSYTDAVAASGVADVRLVAPFLATVPGTDAYVDQL